MAQGRRRDGGKTQAALEVRAVRGKVTLGLEGPERSDPFMQALARVELDRETAGRLACRLLALVG